MRATVAGLFVVGAVLSQGVTLPGAAFAADPTIKCTQTKYKAWGKLRACLSKNSAGIAAGGADASAECQAKFASALQKADDKATAAGVTCHWVDNGDGTVFDLNTGLQWEIKDDTGGIHDKDNVYTWSTGSPYDPNGTAFTTFLGTLNKGISPVLPATASTITGCFANHCDWRMPDVLELATIADHSLPCVTSVGPCINPVFGPIVSSAGTAPLRIPYWATTAFPSVSSAMAVTFDDGTQNFASKNSTSTLHVRAVRSTGL